ncbi:ribosomal protein S10 [Aminobacter niigataensis]|uniref:Ribosomal protein S10 n=1 Tax=Aminobacter niigataensis TaxID=83265 RepID=A0ABR6L879_9HYPH|nr:hypothetical protein [Aminobacter niigataensis]MBB4653012.1 ribosomal protein S10 [Aminobacter niigataensis]
MARTAGIGQQFRIATQATLEETRKQLVKVAKREHARVMGTDPRPTSFQRFVDGRVGAVEEAVKADGIIHYVYPRLDIVAQFAMETLFDRSPLLSGEYRMAHQLFLNGAAVSNLKGWSTGDEVSISNPLPYSRKIEVGSMTMRVPGTSRVYQETAKIVQGRFGNLASVVFTFRAVVGGAIRGSKARDLRYPVLVITER